MTFGWGKRKEMGWSLLWVDIMAKVVRDSNRQPPWAPQTRGERRPRRGHTGGWVQDRIQQLYARGSKSKIYGSPEVKEDEMKCKRFSMSGASSPHITPVTSGFQKHTFTIPCASCATHTHAHSYRHSLRKMINVCITNNIQICRNTAYAHRYSLIDGWEQKVKYPQAYIQLMPHSRHTTLGTQTISSHSFSHKSMSLGALHRCTELAELSRNFQLNLTLLRGVQRRTPALDTPTPICTRTGTLTRTPTPSTTGRKMRAVLKYVRCRQRALQRGGPRVATRVRERALWWLLHPGLWSQRRGKFLGPAGFKVGADFRTNFPRSLSRGKRGTRARAAELPSCTLPPSRHLSGPWEGGGPLSWQSHWLSGLELWLGRRRYLQLRGPSPVSSAL